MASPSGSSLAPAATAPRMRRDDTDGAAAAAGARPSSRPLVAGAAGNVLEWFDFSVYGYFAPVIGREFFPSDDPVASVLSAFTVFASGFLARPFGAAYFGSLGDRRGRRTVMRLSVLLMGVGTALVALLPTYAQIGVAAPILLTLLRLAQGFSVGGEYTGSAVFMVEAAPADRRGIVGGWTNFGSVAGFLLGSAVGAVLSSVLGDAELAAWGWRIAFLLGLSVAAVAAFYRSGVDAGGPAAGPAATTATSSSRSSLSTPPTPPAPSAPWPPAAKGAPASPLREALRQDLPTMLRIAGIILMANVGFYMMFVYVTTFLSERVGVPMASALEIDTLSMSTLLAIVPLGGWLSDRVGRKPILLTASIGAVLFSIPLFLAIRHDDPVWILAGQIGFAVIVGLSFGANAATIVEITRAPTRCTTLSVAYNVTLAIFGGTTPLVAAWLISRTGDELTPAYYVMAMGLLTTIAVLGLEEPRGRPLD